LFNLLLGLTRVRGGSPPVRHDARVRSSGLLRLRMSATWL